MYGDTPAASLYAKLQTRRESFLRRARECSALTIPSVFPPDGHSSDSDLPDPEQGLGARATKHLSSRLLLTLFPPNGSFFRLVPDGVAKEQIRAGGEDQESAIEKELASIEREAHLEVETSGMRTSAAEQLLHLVIGGNACMWLPDDGGLEFFRLDQYVCRRDRKGTLKVLVIREVVDPETLEPAEQALLMVDSDGAPTTSYCDSAGAEVYTKVWLEDKKYRVQQEINGHIVPGSEGNYIPDELPYVPLRWTKVPGEDYGRSVVDEHLGDLKALERLTKAIITGSLAAARLIFLVSPNGAASPKTLSKTPNAGFAYGNEGDVNALQVNKFADFRTAQEIMAVISRRLEQAFLLNSSATRQAERVTAEEIRFMAQELESSLGGVYSILSQEMQLPVARRIMARLSKNGSIFPMDEQTKKHIKPTIVTGVEALGRFQELERFRVVSQILASIIGPEQFAQEVNVGPVIDFAYSAGGVTIEGLAKSREQRAQELQAQQQQQMMQTVLEKGTGPAVQGVSKVQEAERQGG